MEPSRSPLGITAKKRLRRRTTALTHLEMALGSKVRKSAARLSLVQGAVGGAGVASMLRIFGLTDPGLAPAAE